MTGQDQISQLEAERDRLLSMIAYHNGPFYRTWSGARTPTWFVVVASAIVSGIGVLIVAGIFAGQTSASGVLFLVVGLPLLAYILTRKITVFGVTFRVGEALTMSQTRQPAGEPEALQRLADCEARIMKLKEGR